jgi:hypothetical protein
MGTITSPGFRQWNRMQSLNRAEVTSRRRILRRTMLMGSAGLAAVGWVVSVVIVRASGQPAADAMAGVDGSGLGSLTPILMLVTSAGVAALVMMMVSVSVVWRIRLAAMVKVGLTLVLVGAAWGLFTVTILAGLYAAGTNVEEMGGKRPVRD